MAPEDLSAHLGWIRQQFPALQQDVQGRPAIYLDGPGGTQVPQRVIVPSQNTSPGPMPTAMAAFLRASGLMRRSPGRDKRWRIFWAARPMKLSSART